MIRLVAAILLTIASTAASAAGLVAFQFDGASRSHNGWVAPFFESRGVRAGFAVSINEVETDWTLGMTWGQMRTLQDKGHEFLAHGYYHSPLSGATTDLSVLMREVVGGLKVMRSQGISTAAFVAPASAVHPSLILPVRSFYRYGFTVYNGASVEGAVQQMPVDPHRLHRTSLYSVGLQGAMSAIDAAVASDGMVMFYDHDPLQVDYANSMHYSQLSQVVDYAISRGAEIVTPSQALRIAEIRYVNRYAVP